MLEIKELLNNGSLWPGKTPSPEGRYRLHASPCAPFGVRELDERLSSQGLRFGVVHEWILENAISRHQPRLWVPPVLMLTTLVRNALEHHETHSHLPSLKNKLIVFIGRRCWPSADVLDKIFSTLSLNNNWQWHTRTLFINPPTRSLSFKAILETLSNSNVAAVCAEAPYYSMAATRRLQIAAKEGQSIGLIATSPNRDLKISAAYSRWKLTSSPTKDLQPTWQLERLRCRENPEELSCHIKWCFDETRKTYSLHLSSPVVNRYSSPQAARTATNFAVRQKAS